MPRSQRFCTTCAMAGSISPRECNAESESFRHNARYTNEDGPSLPTGWRTVDVPSRLVASHGNARPNTPPHLAPPGTVHPTAIHQARPPVHQAARRPTAEARRDRAMLELLYDTGMRGHLRASV